MWEVNSNLNQHYERAKELRALLNKANYSYYVLDAPEINDTVYDQLYRELIEIESINPSLVSPDSPSQRLGGIPSKGFKSINHKIPLLSLDNLVENKIFGARETHRIVISTHEEVAPMAPPKLIV